MDGSDKKGRSNSGDGSFRLRRSSKRTKKVKQPLGACCCTDCGGFDNQGSCFWQMSSTAHDAGGKAGPVTPTPPSSAAAGTTAANTATHAAASQGKQRDTSSDGDGQGFPAETPPEPRSRTSSEASFLSSLRGMLSKKRSSKKEGEEPRTVLSEPNSPSTRRAYRGSRRGQQKDKGGATSGKHASPVEAPTVSTAADGSDSDVDADSYIQELSDELRNQKHKLDIAKLANSSLHEELKKSKEMHMQSSAMCQRLQSDNSRLQHELMALRSKMQMPRSPQLQHAQHLQPVSVPVPVPVPSSSPSHRARRFDEQSLQSSHSYSSSSSLNSIPLPEDPRMHHPQQQVDMLRQQIERLTLQNQQLRHYLSQQQQQAQQQQQQQLGGMPPDAMRATPTPTSYRGPPQDIVAKLAATTSSLGQLLSRVSTTPAPCLVELTPRWDKQGSPYLHHLNVAVHNLLGILVDSLQRLKPQDALIVLVGAHGWNYYLETPLTTDDLDFGTTMASEAILPFLSSAVQDALDRDDVRLMLHRLQCIQQATADWRDLQKGDHMYQQMCTLLEEAEAMVDPPDDSFHNRLLRILPSDTGWRVQLGHRTLLDVTPIRKENQKLLTSTTATHAALSQLLTTRHVFKYSCPLDPIIHVAPPSLLQRHLHYGLASGCTWRLNKDLSRLRFLSTIFVLQEVAYPQGTALTLVSKGWESLLHKHDPCWGEWLATFRRMLKLVVQLTQTLPATPAALSRQSSVTSLHSIHSATSIPHMHYPQK
eukprot:m.51425 g.51425  ORF g.51425 m.51425 type:complete len:760 (-) comp11239_c0_seq1:94-2373(-)